MSSTNGSTFKFIPANEEQRVAADACRRSDVTFLVGRVGSGKTHIALGVAGEEVLAGRAKRIILIRPNVPVGRSLGCIPGTFDDKLLPWTKAVADCLESLTFQKASEFVDKHVELAPVETLRGRTFRRCFVLVDEASNLWPHELRLVLSRLGPECRMVLTGDPGQCDRRNRNGTLSTDQALETVASRLDGLSVPGDGGRLHSVAVCRLTKTVRHPLVETIDQRLSDF